MKQLLTFRALTLSTLFLSCDTTAQTLSGAQTPCSTSGEGKAGDAIISYTIAEMVLVNSFQHGNLLVTQGILQPGRSAVDNSLNIFFDGEIKVFPNPTVDLLTVQLGLFITGKVQIELSDATGKLLLREELLYSRFTSEQLKLSRYAAGSYLLKIVFISANGTTKRGVFKIVKTS